MNEQRNAFFSLKDRVALITGAAAGIGKAIAERYLLHGAKVVIFDKNDQVAQIARTFNSADISGYQVDVTDKQAVAENINTIIKLYGQLDIVVNSAGIVLLQPAEQLTEAYWDATLSVNLKGTFLVCQQAGRHMLKQRRGRIINMASQAGVIALPQHIAYCASKAAVIGLTQVLALEWGAAGITVNAISPTVVLTELGIKAWSGAKGEAMKQKIPARRFAQPEHIAAAALYLASDEASMTNGANLVIDGGYSIQ